VSVGRSLLPEQQAALVLREVAGMSEAEAARALDVTGSVFRHHLAQARTGMTRAYERTRNPDGSALIACSRWLKLLAQGKRGLRSWSGVTTDLERPPVDGGSGRRRVARRWPACRRKHQLSENQRQKRRRMARLEDLPEWEREHLLQLRDEAPRFDTTPWKDGPPLRQRRVALISTAGLHRRGDRPFTGGAGATEYRVIPADARGGSS
jgi:hypothetical protein